MSTNAGLIDTSLDLSGQIVDQDFLGTRGRLKMCGFGQIPQFYVKEITRQPNMDEAAPASVSDDDPLQQVGICFVNLRVQAHWLQLVSVILV